MTTYSTDDYLETHLKRNIYEESKLTYADYHGDIPTDDDPADYYVPIKVVYVS